MTPEEILNLRMTYKLSQKKMAIKAEVSPLTWLSWEKGYAKPSRLNQQTLLNLRKKLDEPYTFRH